MTEQRHHDLASVATDTSVGVRSVRYSGIGVGVGNIERCSIANDPGGCQQTDLGNRTSGFRSGYAWNAP